MKLPGEANAWTGRLRHLAPGTARKAAAIAVAGATKSAGWSRPIRRLHPVPTGIIVTLVSCQLQVRPV